MENTPLSYINLLSIPKGAKCNMAVFNGKKQPSEENCFLFHCLSEQDCPLMKALDGINTYDIYKGKCLYHIRFDCD